MGIVDKAKEMMGSQSEKVEQGIDKGGDFIDQRTDNKYSRHVDTAQDKAKDAVRSLGNNQNRQQDSERDDNPPQPPAA